MRDGWDSVDYYFARRLEEAMAAKGLDRKDLEDCGIVSVSSLREYIECGRLPNLRTACRIAEFLDCSVDWLCGFKEEPQWSDDELEKQRRAPWL
jgi:transcriptional regulator with XRE-family HTH domain